MEMKHLGRTLDTQNSMDQPAAQERILKAARTLFSQKGFKGTTTKMIALEAGVNEVTLFRNFQNKENLLVQIINSSLNKREDEELLNCLNSKMKSIEDVEKMLVHFGIIFYNQYLVNNREIVLINLFEVGERPEITGVFAKNISRIVGLLTDKLQQLQTAGIIKGSQLAAASLIYVQSLIGTFIMEHRINVDFFPLSSEDTCKKAAKVLLYGVG